VNERGEHEADDASVPATTGAQPEVVDMRSGMFGGSGTGDTSGYGRLVRAVAMPPATAPPYGGVFDEIADSLAAALVGTGFETAVERVVVDRGEITFHVRREHLI